MVAKRITNSPLTPLTRRFVILLWDLSEGK